MPELQSKSVQRSADRSTEGSAAGWSMRDAVRGMSYEEGAAALTPVQRTPVQMKRAVQMEDGPPADEGGSADAGPPGPEPETAPVGFGEVVSDTPAPQADNGEALRAELLLLNAQLDGLRVQAGTAAIGAAGGGHVAAVTQKQAGDMMSNLANSHADAFKGAREGAPQLARQLGNQAKGMYEQACSAYALAAQISREAGKVRSARSAATSAGYLCRVTIGMGRELPPDVRAAYDEGTMAFTTAEGLRVQAEAMSPTQGTISNFITLCDTASMMYLKAFEAHSLADSLLMHSKPEPTEDGAEPKPPDAPVAQRADDVARAPDDKRPDDMEAEPQPSPDFSDLAQQLNDASFDAHLEARSANGEAAKGAGSIIAAAAAHELESADFDQNEFRRARAQGSSSSFAAAQAYFQGSLSSFRSASASYAALGKMEQEIGSVRSRRQAAMNASPVCAAATASGKPLAPRAEQLHGQAAAMVADADPTVEAWIRKPAGLSEVSGWCVGLRVRGNPYDQAVPVFRQADAEQESGPPTPYRR